jgi:cytochrome P450
MMPSNPERYESADISAELLREQARDGAPPTDHTGETLTTVAGGNRAPPLHADLRRLGVFDSPTRYMPSWARFLRFLRTCLPIIKLGPLVVVTRYEDVVDVLTNDEVFKVPFGEEMARLNDGRSPGTPFILGMDCPSAHDEQLALIQRSFTRDDIDAVVKPMCKRFAEESIAASSGEHFDAIENLITKVPLRLCEEYYGIPIKNPRRFALATFKVSGFLFGRPPVTPAKASKRDGPFWNRDKGISVDEYADYARGVVDEAIRAGPKKTMVQKGTILNRLLDAKSAARVDHARARAFLLDMIIGFVPTNTLAGGHILDLLLDKPALLEEARSAALAGDDDLLERCLFETLRFNPHNPGPFRVCRGPEQRPSERGRDDLPPRCEKVAEPTASATRELDTQRRDGHEQAWTYELASDKWYRTKVKPGMFVWVLTKSAMLDARHVARPYQFDPSRAASDSLLFGYGLHWCAGAFIARAQLTQTFKVLLQRGGLKRSCCAAGRMQRAQGFPLHLCVDFQASEAAV